MQESIRKFLSACIPLLLIACTPLLLQASGKYTEAHVLVDNSDSTLKQFIADPNMSAFRDLSKRARAILVIPQSLRGGLLIGGTGGSGVLLARDMKTGQWKGPAFYTLGSVTFGLQIGAEASQVVMMVMTEKGLRSLLTSSFKLGADVTVAAGPIGAGAKAATADILAYARSKGAFGGFTVEGAVIKTKDGWNTSYYGLPATPSEILISGAVENAHANDLRKLITEIATPTTKKVAY